uniref:ribonuclease H n=1 Tax=Knipowitschia caucasica TaxID=637954 RepID=A0AAV2JWI0_KNICA
MDSVLRDMPFIFVYLDDILVASPSVEEHSLHLRLLFERLTEHGLIVNPVKCQFGLSEIEFLGHRVSRQGAVPLPAKIVNYMEVTSGRFVKQKRRRTASGSGARCLNGVEVVALKIFTCFIPNEDVSWCGESVGVCDVVGCVDLVCVTSLGVCDVVVCVESVGECDVVGVCDVSWCWGVTSVVCVTVSCVCGRQLVCVTSDGVCDVSWCLCVSLRVCDVVGVWVSQLVCVMSVGVCASIGLVCVTYVVCVDVTDGVCDDVGVCGVVGV